MAARPAQGNNSKPVATAKPRYVQLPGPKVRSQGSVSRPKALPKPRLGPDTTPLRRVRNPQTIVE